MSESDGGVMLENQKLKNIKRKMCIYNYYWLLINYINKGIYISLNFGIDIDKIIE